MERNCLKELPTIDPFGCEGFEINLLEKRGKICGITSREGFVNQYDILNQEAEKEYAVFNREDRINTPLLMKNGEWKAITMEEAVAIIEQKIRNVHPTENALFASSKLSNELLYLIQKWSRAGIQSNAIHSFQYLEIGTGYNLNKNDILPIHEFLASERVYVIGSELDKEHSIIHTILQKKKDLQQVPTTLITDNSKSPYIQNVDNNIPVNDYFAFFRAVNHYLLHTHQAFGIFTEGLAKNFENYKQQILNEDFNLLLQKSDVNISTIEKFVAEILQTPKCAFIISEKSTSLTLFLELKNLMLLVEKQAKPSSGILLLRKTNNSQGIYDMGITPELGAGNRLFTNDYIELLKKNWHIKILATDTIDVGKQLRQNQFKNLFIFGENPIKTASQYAESIKNADFVVVQSCFANETTATANMILPMNFPFEIGGSFTSAFKVSQHFDAVKKCPFEWNDYHFFAQLHQKFGLSALTTPKDIFLEMIDFFPAACCGGIRHQFE